MQKEFQEAENIVTSAKEVEIKCDFKKVSAIAPSIQTDWLFQHHLTRWLRLYRNSREENSGSSPKVRTSATHASEEAPLFFFLVLF